MGGAEQFVVDICSAINQQQADMASILSFGEATDSLVELCKQDNVPVFHVKKGGRIKQFVHLRQLLQQFEHIHIHSSHCLATILFITRLSPHLKLYYTRHNTVVHITKKWRFIYRIAARYLQQIVFIAEVARVEFLKVYPQFQNKSTLIYNGIKPIKVDGDKPRANTPIRLGQVGRFVPLKAQRLLIQALKLLSTDQQQTFELHFFGDGPLIVECQELAKPLQQTMQVIFHGLEMDKTRIYANIDVLIVTSETEGLSLVMLEAISAGCLVIATNVGGNPEIIQHNTDGILFESNDLNQLSVILKKLISNDKIELLLENSYQKFLDNFTQDKCVKKYLSLYAKDKK